MSSDPMHSNRRPRGSARRLGHAVVGITRHTVSLVVDDGAVALGVVLAVVIAALLTERLGPGNAIGWILFTLVWAAIGVSLWRARPRQ